MTKKKRRSRRTYSDDEYESESRRGRDDGYRSEGHGRHQSFDGADDDYYDSINDRPRRQRSRADLYRGREERPERRSRRGDARVDGGFSYGGSPVNPPANAPPMSPTQAEALAAGAAAGAAAAGYGSGSPPYPQASPLETNYSPRQFSPQPIPPAGQQHPGQHNRSTSTLRGGMATGYVPYADIYGGPTGNPPPASDIGSVQPNYMNQVAAPVAQQSYQQNPFAQEAPPGSQPSYMPDPYYNTRTYDDRYDQQARGVNGYDGFESETERAPSRSRSRSKSRRDSRDSYDDRSRARSRRRNDSRVQLAPPKRGKSGIREHIDTSERGLGYSAVGALAGGLVGSEFGKGAVPSAIGAVLGAMGANAFQARERYVDPRVPLRAQLSSPMVSHHSSSNAR